MKKSATRVRSPLVYQHIVLYFIIFQLFKETWFESLYITVNYLLGWTFMLFTKDLQASVNLLSEILNVPFHIEMVWPCGGNANWHPRQHHCCSCHYNRWRYVHIKVSQYSLSLLYCWFGVSLCSHEQYLLRRFHSLDEQIVRCKITWYWGGHIIWFPNESLKRPVCTI